MSGELRAATASGNTVYAHVLNQNSRIWNGTSFEVYNAVNYLSYSIHLTEQGSSGVYVGDFPVGVTDEAQYDIFNYSRLGGADAEGDPIVGTGTVDWDGSAVVVPADIASGEMSGSDWKAYVLRSFKRTDKDTELFEATNAAVAEIRRKMRTSRDEKETVITDTINTLGEYKLDVETDLGTLISDVFIRDAGDGRYLDRISKATYDDRYGKWGTGASERNIPREYCVFANQILFGPVPDSINYVYVMSYTRANLTPVTSASTAVPYTTEDYKEIVRNGTLWRLYKLVENDDQAGAYKALWDDGLMQIERGERENRQATVFVAYHDI